MGGVNPFLAQQSADFAWLSAAIRSLQNAAFSLLENCRRRPVAATSGSGRASEGALEAARRAAGNAPSDAENWVASILSSFNSIMIFDLSFYSNLRGVGVSGHIGTGGFNHTI
jgi:hypothetical protein